MKVTFKTKKIHDYPDATWKKDVGGAVHLMKTVVKPNNEREAVCVAVLDKSTVDGIEETIVTPAQVIPAVPAQIIPASTQTVEIAP